MNCEPPAALQIRALNTKGLQISKFLAAREWISQGNDLDCDVILGDFNVRLGPMLGTSGEASPLARYHLLALWMAGADMAALPPSIDSTATSRWDHVLVESELWETLSSALTIFTADPALLPTDHPALQLRVPLQPASCPLDEAAPDPGLARMHLGRLHKPGAWRRLQEAYDVLCPLVDDKLTRAEEAVRCAASDEALRQEVVDAADAVLHEAVLSAGFCTLGKYDVNITRARFDWTRARLAHSVQPADAERLWRKALRGRNRPMVASDDGAAGGRTVRDEAVEVWGAAWGAHLPPPTQPPDGRLPPGPVNALSDTFARHFSVSDVERVIRRYPRHKTGGEDGDHGLLFAALSFDQPDRTSPPAPSASPDAIPTTVASVSASAPLRSSARLRAGATQALNPRAALIVPLSARQPTAPPRTRPFPAQFARLFRLCAECRVIPRRWGRALFHLIVTRLHSISATSA
ncbi:hypothetical protein OC842_001587 [Tilletia horrida]|uniref:Endonuclease/exonuclease/phosphatase domain-containing protein n=1 Tax=Tilletia horrida TaxID=155126 RepID=A0AAN6GHF4_9BASI|nr:hypothetical protein OC842_001587 [Tilletia horrida]